MRATSPGALAIKGNGHLLNNVVDGPYPICDARKVDGQHGVIEVLQT